MPVYMNFYFPDEDAEYIFKHLKRLHGVTGKSNSQMVREALEQFIDRETKLIQTKLDTFKAPVDPLVQKFMDQGWVESLAVRKAEQARKEQIPK